MSQFVMKLKAKTSGIIKGARMVEVARANNGGSFVVQVACLPEVPDCIEGYYRAPPQSPHHCPRYRGCAACIMCKGKLKDCILY